ncbi:MAG: transglycosylase SLT domain-containing protein [Muribaculaceae bacterium]|nr:transglycosylase SLT domain-containing protein [Muribaculaceae bacterium]
MIKKFVLSLIISCGALAATALPNVNNLRDTINDNDIVAPYSLETHERMADSLAKEWYYQQYVTISTPIEKNAKSRSKSETPSDELYIKRLQYLQNEGGFTIEMPYNNVVKKYIEMYTSSRRRGLVEKMLGLWLYYEPIFEEALLKEGIPVELKYLPIIESALNPNAVSPAAAAGLWQFIPSTGKGMGLEINSTVDERRDTYKASQKAAEFLHQLYNTYGDWSLVIAAYNCGPGNVNKAIRRAGGGKKDYWEIYNYLPKETRGYVPAFIAAAYVMNYHNEHGISTAIAKKPIVTDTVDVRRRINFRQIADVINIDIDAIEALNPQYLKNTIPAGPTKPYKLILPSKYCYMYVSCEDIIGSKDSYKYKGRERAEPGQRREDPKPDDYKNTEQNKPQYNVASNNSESSSSSNNVSYTSKEDVVMHEVKSGETLKSIANKYGTNTSRIKKDNNLSSNTVSRGQVLKITTYKKVLSDDSNIASNTTNTRNSSKTTNTVASNNSYNSKSYSYNNDYSNNDNYTYKKKKSSRKKKSTYNPTENNKKVQQATPSYKSNKKKSSTKSVAKVSNNKKGQKQVAQKSKKNNKKDVASTSKSKSKSSSKDVKSSKSKSKKSTSIGKTSKSKSKTASKTSSKKDKKSSTSKSSSSKDKKKSTTSKSSSSKKTTKATDKKKSSSTKAKATDKKKSTTSNKKATTKSSSGSSKKSTASKSKSSASKKSTASKSSSSKKSSKKKK